VGSDDSDGVWFEAAYHRYYDDVLRYGLRRLGDRGDAEELAQETFTVLWRRRREVREPVRPWLYGVARHLLANEWRARGRQPRFVDLDGLHGAADMRGAGRTDGVDAVLDVVRAMATLSDGDREVLSLVGWEALPIREVAVALRCTTMTATVRLFRARRRLLAALHQPTGPARARDTSEGDVVAHRS
jgi:RNA polymerase sigma-70 factor (ECF subfamily)